MQRPCSGPGVDLAVDDEGDPLLVRTSRQQSAVVVLDPIVAHGNDCGPVDSMPVPELLEHSVLEVPLEVGDGAVDRRAGPKPLKHSGVSETADPPSASPPRIHLEVSGDGRNGQPDHMCEEITLRDIRSEDKGPRRRKERPSWWGLLARLHHGS